MLIRLQHLPVAFPRVLGFERGIDQLFDRYLDRTWDPFAGGFPAVEVSESANETVVIAELPGVKREDITITVKDGVLTIGGERKALELPADGSCVRSEIPHGEFRRSIALTHPLKLGDVSAELKNGLLRIRLPKAEEARAREIQVN